MIPSAMPLLLPALFNACVCTFLKILPVDVGQETLREVHFSADLDHPVSMGSCGANGGLHSSRAITAERA
jgi:hypothetical protein